MCIQLGMVVALDLVLVSCSFLALPEVWHDVRRHHLKAVTIAVEPYHVCPSSLFGAESTVVFDLVPKFCFARGVKVPTRLKGQL